MVMLKKWPKVKSSNVEKLSKSLAQEGHGVSWSPLRSVLWMSNVHLVGQIRQFCGFKFVARPGRLIILDKQKKWPKQWQTDIRSYQEGWYDQKNTSIIVFNFLRGPTIYHQLQLQDVHLHHQVHRHNQVHLHRRLSLTWSLAGNVVGRGRGTADHGTEKLQEMITKYKYIW